MAKRKDTRRKPVVVRPSAGTDTKEGQNCACSCGPSCGCGCGER